jgi:hypothetical protein
MSKSASISDEILYSSSNSKVEVKALCKMSLAVFIFYY